MKHKFLLPVVILSALSFTVAGQNRSISFSEKPWAEILSQAKSLNRMIFLDGYASWCGPCKWMAANMFTRDTIADYYNNTFICAHFDMEKGEGVQLARLYQVKAYPSLLFLSPDGELVHKRVGAPQLVADYFDMAHAALTPGEGFVACMKKYQEGERDPKFMIKYLGRVSEAYMPVNEPLKEYFATQKPADLVNRDNWSIIYKYVSDMDSQEFNYLLKYQKEYGDLYTVDSVSSKIFSVFLQSLITVCRSSSFNEGMYNQIKEKIRASGYAGVEKVIFASDLNLYQMKSDMQRFITLAMTDLDKYYSDDYEALNSIAWTFSQITAEKTNLEKASGWARRSIALKSTAENNNTYASLMFKLGNKAEAVRYEKTAIELARKENIPLKKFEDTLKRFEEKPQ